MKGKSDMRMPEEFLEMDNTEAELLSGGESENEEMHIAKYATGIASFSLLGIGGLTYCLGDLRGNPYYFNSAYTEPSENATARKMEKAGAIIAGIGAASGVAYIILNLVDDS